MTDFFADLERQLVDATPGRAQRIRRARVRRAAAVSTVLLALVAGGAGLASAVGGSDAGTSSSGSPAATAPPAQTVPVAPGATAARGSSTVAVLNGTTVPGLARGVANRLQAARFKIGNVTNAANQDRARTQVFYARTKDIPAATEVATAIGLRGDFALTPITRAERAIAGDQAAVVVLVGSDQNTAPRG